MSDRERWIVYPLLFLTLGIALRNQFLPTRRFGAFDLHAGEVSAQSIRCNQLVVNEEADFKKVLKFQIASGNYLKAGLSECERSKTRLAECRALQVVSKEGKSLVTAEEDQKTNSGFIQTLNSQGIPLVQIRPSEYGGMVTAWGQGGKVLVALGHSGQNPGVFAQYPLLGSRVFSLTPQLPLHLEPAPAPSTPKTPQGQKPAEEQKNEEKEKEEKK